MRIALLALLLLGVLAGCSSEPKDPMNEHVNPPKHAPPPPAGG